MRIIIKCKFIISFSLNCYIFALFPMFSYVEVINFPTKQVLQHLKTKERK